MARSGDDAYWRNLEPHAHLPGLGVADFGVRNLGSDPAEPRTPRSPGGWRGGWESDASWCFTSGLKNRLANARRHVEIVAVEFQKYGGNCLDHAMILSVDQQAQRSRKLDAKL
jgi:hypothetical protein